ncbi:hypothetical protein FEK35_02565 [Nocardia cyriacigeorgica]|uniref:Uncharacterized protein n=1 Tax=Nocardia cyriacigeorgica TaxID=135487 RepID=A0A5R8PLA4_9NOCA|nr:hypothetical protein FEK35_02565 [Nocardia cyriacigeorgica]
MNEIEYAFGTGDGTVDVWSTQANLELAGSPDAVQLDFDGDGLIDDAMWDTQGDGVADVAALDLNDDGVLDAFFTDPSGHGVWDHQITGSTADAASEPLDWIVRGEAPPAPGGYESPAGYEVSHPAPPADPVTGQVPPHPIPPADGSTGYGTQPHPPAPAADSAGAPQVPPLAEQPGAHPASPIAPAAAFAGQHAGHPASEPPVASADPFTGHPAPSHPAPTEDSSSWLDGQPPAGQPGGVAAPPQLMPPEGPFARPDVQPGNPAGLVVNFNLEMQVNASLGQPETSADPAVAGFAADGQL